MKMKSQKEIDEALECPNIGVKFSGQCEHGTPIGRNCAACDEIRMGHFCLTCPTFTIDKTTKACKHTTNCAGVQQVIKAKQGGNMNESKNEMHDSGKREGFSTGAVRDASEDKAMLSLISPIAEERLGQWLTRGAKKYAARNWEKGMPMSRTFDSLKRHINKYLLGDRSEDHLAAIMCNIMFLIHFEEMIAVGKLPAELDDLPRYIDECTKLYLTMVDNEKKDEKKENQ